MSAVHFGPALMTKAGPKWCKDLFKQATGREYNDIAINLSQSVDFHKFVDAMKRSASYDEFKSSYQAWADIIGDDDLGSAVCLKAKTYDVRMAPHKLS